MNRNLGLSLTVGLVPCTTYGTILKVGRPASSRNFFGVVGKRPGYEALQNTDSSHSSDHLC